MTLPRRHLSTSSFRHQKTVKITRKAWLHTYSWSNTPRYRPSSNEGFIRKTWFGSPPRSRESSFDVHGNLVGSITSDLCVRYIHHSIHCVLRLHYRTPRFVNAVG